MKYKVSIAIPIYNASKYLNRCLDSLINQSIGLDNIEIICVDDCSSDNSVDIIKEYCNKYPQSFKLLKRSKNSGGAGAPRNDSIRLAQGEYIFFVDSDDYLGEKAVEKMYKYAKKNNSDVVIGKYKGVNGRGVPKAAFENGNVSKAEILKDSLFYTLAPHKMFKLKTITDLNIEFNEEIKTAEDQLFVVEFFCNCEVISILSEYECYYLTNHGCDHLSSSRVKAKDYFVIMSKIVECIKNSRLDDKEYKNKLIAKFLTRMFRHGRYKKFYNSSKLNLQDKLECLKYYSEFLNNYVDDEVDKYVTNQFYLITRAIRDNDLLKIQLVEEINDLKMNIQNKDKEIKELNLKIDTYKEKTQTRIKKFLRLCK